LAGEARERLSERFLAKIHKINKIDKKSKAGFNGFAEISYYGANGENAIGDARYGPQMDQAGEVAGFENGGGTLSGISGCPRCTSFSRKIFAASGLPCGEAVIVLLAILCRKWEDSTGMPGLFDFPFPGFEVF
jgi:hypothetical protein